MKFSSSAGFSWSAPCLHPPGAKPQRPWFSSGPCVKPVEWNMAGMAAAAVGQSHRSDHSVAQLRKVTERLKELLGIPQNHWVGLTPGSATGAIEMAMWNFMTPQREVDVWVWDIFSQYWAQGLHRLLPGRVHEIHPGQGALRQQETWAESLAALDIHRDVVLTWCGTTHGVWMGPLGAEVLKERFFRGDGLIFADLASAVMTTPVPWDHVDVATFSWQKGLGGEAHLGVLVLGPRALERWHNTTPSWPIPRLYRLKDGHGERITGPFFGEMIHTCSMLVVQEYDFLLDVWTQRGGETSAIAATRRNMEIVKHWCAQEEHGLGFVVEDEAWRAHGPLLLQPTHPSFAACSPEEQWRVLQQVGRWLAQQEVGYDVLNHARAFPAFRLWCGPTVEACDMERLLPWLSYAVHQAFPPTMR